MTRRLVAPQLPKLGVSRALRAVIVEMKIIAHAERKLKRGGRKKEEAGIKVQNARGRDERIDHARNGRRCVARREEMSVKALLPTLLRLVLFFFFFFFVSFRFCIFLFFP